MCLQILTNIRKHNPGGITKKGQASYDACFISKTSLDVS